MIRGGFSQVGQIILIVGSVAAIWTLLWFAAIDQIAGYQQPLVVPTAGMEGAADLVERPTED